MPRAEVDLPRCAVSGQVFRWENDGENRLFGVDGLHAYWVETEPGDPQTFHVESNAAESDFRSLFRLETSLVEVCKKLLELSPELAPYAKGLPGLRIMRPTATAETAISFLCTPNNSLHRIVPMVKRLAAKGEVLLEHRGRTIYAFPSIGQVADLSEAELKEAKFGYRARTIPEIARQMIDRGGEEWLEDLKQKPYEQVHKELIELTGIGPKLADCIALFALDKTEAVPLDTHMWKMAVKHYFPQFEGKTVTGKRYQEVSEFFRDQFGELAGWAQQLLFYDSLTGGQATIDA